MRLHGGDHMASVLGRSSMHPERVPLRRIFANCVQAEEAIVTLLAASNPKVEEAWVV